jgi:hypothetical protein
MKEWLAFWPLSLTLLLLGGIDYIHRIVPAIVAILDLRITIVASWI